jgi:hypothetical protein
MLTLFQIYFKARRLLLQADSEGPSLISRTVTSALGYISPRRATLANYRATIRAPQISAYDPNMEIS